MPSPSRHEQSHTGQTAAGFPSTYWVTIPSTNRGEPTS
jgi:hypothetical protein